jgi:hypothetical protein
MVRDSLSRVSRWEVTPTNMGLVETKNTELATLVYSKDAIQNVKCRLSSTPETMAHDRSLLLNARSSPWRLNKPTGATIREAISRR